MKTCLLLPITFFFMGCSVLSPYQRASNEISKVYMDSTGVYKIGYWYKENDDKTKSAGDKDADLNKCIFELTAENAGRGNVNVSVASAQLVNCMLEKGWHLDFEQVVL